uniref:ATP synthase F0 subunit 8 n=1 Tax=Aphrophora memorabilis TaxID=2815126 RepID=UPI0023AAC503|nr:ATP synthase F0 subunit 8 [Aphrophora memorabilis]WCH58178.1 ATP synthase F0 subunit 8 [Aphrophora memorabilis]
MPQMAPMSWTLLFLMFILSYLMFNMNIYFIQNFENMKKKNNNITKQMNWKW